MLWLLVTARWLLAAVFALAAFGKLTDREGSRKSLEEFGLPGFLAPLAALLLPLAEIACAVALIPAGSAHWGAAGVLALLLLFMLAIAINLARGHRPDCHCFGQVRSEQVGGKTLARNAVLAALALLALWLESRLPSVNALPWMGTLSGLEMAAAAFTALAILQLGFSFRLLRQNGRPRLRVEALESASGTAAAAPPPVPTGLPVNSPAPGFSLPSLDGGTVTLDMLRAAAKPVLLVFGEPACSLCVALMPEVAAWQREYAGRLSIVPISRGPLEDNRVKVAKHGVSGILLQKDRETAQAYLVTGSPTAVLLRDGLIASPLAEGAEAIRALVGSATLPAPVKKGDTVPSLRLADLKGKTLDLATLRGRRTLLLFWNQSCGFCQQMLADVKNWERHRPPEAPELLVISAGSFESNQRQGFRSRVLLDPNFGAGEVFNAGGTPSAVLVDERGQVASDVSVGAQEVLALAGAAALRA